MRYKPLLLAILIVLLLLGGTGAALVFLVCHEPAFYTRAAAPPGQHRLDCSGDCVKEFNGQLINGVLNRRQWDALFTEEQINCYFAEDFLKQNVENPLPQGVSEPRVALDTDGIRLGFRYGTGSWSTVISLDLQIWLVRKEPNVVALEF